jgi:hypothetical protein
VNTSDAYIGENYTGSIDDLRMYNGIVLTQEQINTIYNEGKGKKYHVDDAGAGLAFNFDENTGTTTESVGTATLTGTFSEEGVTWQSGGTPFDTGGGIFMDIFEEMWEN